MKKGKSTSEFDNPINVPTLSRKPGVGVREFPSKVNAEYGKHHEASQAPKSKSIQFGRGKKRQKKAAEILAKARKGK